MSIKFLFFFEELVNYEENFLQILCGILNVND